MKKYWAFCIPLICLCSISCRKDESRLVFSLPAETRSGKNTLGFLFNSVVWTNYGQICFPFAGGCQENLRGIYYPDGSVLINADRVLRNKSDLISTGSIAITLKTGLGGVGDYSTSNGDSLSLFYIYKTTSNIDSMYILPQSHPVFNITISRLDTINKILSGTFSGKLFKRMNYADFGTSSTDSINIDSGRFDIKLR